MGIIIASFPGCGKTYLMNTYGSKIKIADSLAILKDDEQVVDAVMDNIDDYDIIFIPTDKPVLEEFNNRSIDYDVFYPSPERRNEFLENMVRKRALRNDIMMLDRNFISMIGDIDEIESENCFKHKMTEKGHFVGNDVAIMQYITGIIDKMKSENNKKQNKENNEQS